jgi:TIR domain
MAATASAERPPDKPVRDPSRKVFVSYAREDQKFALRLAGELEAAGLTVWIDRTGIEGGSDWSQRIEDAIRASTEVVLILSPDSTASDFVKKEVIFAQQLEIPVRPVLYRPCEPWLLVASTQYVDFTEWHESALEELLKRPARRRTSWRRIRIFLKKFYRPLLAVLALALGIAASVYFLSPSDTSFTVSGGDSSSLQVRVRNRGGRPAMLVATSFKLHFGSLPIETEPLVLLQPETHTRIAGHGDVIVRLTADRLLTQKMRDEESYFTPEDIRPLLAGAKLTLTAQVKESDDRVHTRSDGFPAERIKNFILEELSNAVP